jgi:hypothetical protein
MGRRLMRAMLETQVLARESRALPSAFGPVTPEARVPVVRFRVAAHARRIGRKMQRLDVTRGGHVLMAIDAIDPVCRVRAMLERVGRVSGTNAEQARARRQSERRDDAERERELHGLLQLRERRASALAS